MSSSRCLNCDATLADADRFCPRCAQRTDSGRLSLHDIARDVLQTFVNVERGPLAFARALLTRPGGVAREYVEGKRRRHYGPFATLVVLVGLTALAVNLSDFQVLAQDRLPAAPAHFLQRHFNILLLAQLPAIGGACALLFRGAGLTLAEHTVLAAYTLSVRALVVALVAPLSYLLSIVPGPGSTYGFWAVWYVYFGWAASQFYAGPRLSSWLRGVLAAAIAHAATLGGLLAGSAVYAAIVAPR